MVNKKQFPLRLFILLIVFLICLAMLYMENKAQAETETVYILCQPKSYVNIRQGANKDTEVLGRFEIGQELQTDGVKRNGYLHLVDLSLESSTGWVYAGYITNTPVTMETLQTYIESNGRVACRKYVNGRRKKWLNAGDDITVYGYSEEWAITDMGYVQTQYIYIEGW